MNDEPTSIWRKPWKGARGVFLWFGLVAVAVFVVILCFVLVTGPGSSFREALQVSSLSALVIALVAVLGFAFVRWLCCWRNFRRFLFGLACGVTVVALVYVQENWRGKRAWDKHRRALEARGEKLIVSQLTPPPVPDEKNFALTPLLKPALDFAHVDGRAVWRDTNALRRLENINAQLPGTDKSGKLVPGSFEKGTFADLEACRQFYRGNTNYPQPTAPGTAAQEILVALGKFDAELKELRDAAAARPYSRFPIEYDYQPPWEILLPHLARIKGLCALTQMRAVAQLDAGRASEALDELKLGFRLSDSISEEPLLIDHLVRVASVAIDLQIVREGLVRHTWDDTQLADIEKELGSLNLLAECRLAIRGERALTMSGLEYMCRGNRREMYYLVGDGSSSSTGAAVWVPRGWFYQNMLRISQMEQDFMIAAVDEKTHRIFPETAEGFHGALEKMRTGPYTIFAKLLVPALGGAIKKSSRMQTYVDEARLACAIERFRIANNKLPETLDALAPRFIERIPTDVIDGKPLRYKANADGSYILYSVGWNKTDDGGEVVWAKAKEPSADLTKGDWVWQMPSK